MATPFSLMTNSPRSVTTASDMFPSVCPGVLTIATPGPSHASPSSSTTRSLGNALDATFGTYQTRCIGCRSFAPSHSARCTSSFARGKNAGRPSPPSQPRTSWMCRWSNAM